MANLVLNMPRLTVTITREQSEWLDLQAERRNMKVSAVVREALTNYMELSTANTVEAAV